VAVLDALQNVENAVLAAADQSQELHYK
jgi:hypothetical protein